MPVLSPEAQIVGEKARTNFVIKANDSISRTAKNFLGSDFRMNAIETIILVAINSITRSAIQVVGCKSLKLVPYLLNEPRTISIIFSFVWNSPEKRLNIKKETSGTDPMNCLETRLDLDRAKNKVKASTKNKIWPSKNKDFRDDEYPISIFLKIDKDVKSGNLFATSLAYLILLPLQK
ncbi:hypothetical protein ACPD8N_00975 [Lacticaseibacillus chiayiensis]|uniref:hypothetical protein n=1 Tax=Lacticaseibacillus chiayiensis TaxID=2100821 RepID=UPI003C76CD32